MKKMTKAEILKQAKENGVEFVRLQFTDLFGVMKNVAITVSQLEKALDDDCMFDGSSINGFARIDGEEIPVAPGDVIRIPPNAMHTVVNRENAELLWAALWWEIMD